MGSKPYSIDGRRCPVESEFAPYPALWRRAGACLIDVAIACVFVWCGALALLTAVTPSDSGANAFGLGPDSRSSPIVIIFLLLASLWLTSLGMFYIPFEEAREAGQTLGKRVFGLRMVRLRDGRPLGTAGAFGRYVARLTDLTGVGILWAALDPHRRTLHDCIAGTVVVDARRFRPTRSAFRRGAWRADAFEPLAETVPDHDPVTIPRRLLRFLVAVLAVFDVVGIVVVTLAVVDAMRFSA